MDGLPRMASVQTKTIEVSQLSPGVAELLAMLGNTDEIVLAVEGKAVARLLATDAPATEAPRVMGLFEGQGWISDDFNDPLPDEFWGGRV